MMRVHPGRGNLSHARAEEAQSGRKEGKLPSCALLRPGIKPLLIQLYLITGQVTTPDVNWQSLR